MALGANGDDDYGPKNGRSASDPRSSTQPISTQPSLPNTNEPGNRLRSTTLDETGRREAHCREPLINGTGRPESQSSGLLADGMYDGEQRRRHLSFSRLAYNLPAFNEEFDRIDSTKRRGIEPCGAGNFVFEKARDSCCFKSSIIKKLKSVVPIVEWAPKYNFKQCLLADFIAGLTIIVFHVPQSMGYALIAQVPPVYGLYSAFYPALLYAFLGTSRQAAVGE